MRLTNCLAASIALAVAAVAFAGDEADDKGLKLTVGDKAPAIDIAHWVKGDQIEEFEEGKIYVVEFWATWCPPCRDSMPHLSELQEKLKDYDVTIVGVSDEPLQTVAKFLVEKDDEAKMWWDKTRYTLTTDPDRSVYTDYMTAAAQNGIPTSFVVGKDGHVEWIGHPTALDSVLEDVVHDKWNRDEYKAEWEKQMSSQVEFSKLVQAWRAARMNGDWTTAQQKADELIALGNDQFKVQKFLTYVGPMNDPKQGYAYGNTIAEELWDNEQMLNQMAWEVVDTDGIQTRNLEFALKLATRANELTDSEDGAILDTLARVYYEMGDIDNALKYQRLAVKHSTEQFRADLEDALEKYEAEAKSAKR
jgi:thiol-disulfide isomerase/thioredoxin